MHRLGKQAVDPNLQSYDCTFWIILLFHLACVSLVSCADYDHRLIEGDSELKQVHQDIDCRPSDGIWLAIKVTKILIVIMDDMLVSTYVLFHKWL